MHAVATPIASTPWPLFEVKVDGFEPSIVAAPSRGKARYSRFLEFTEAYPDCTFAEWCRIANVRRMDSDRPGRADPYSYVRRNYDVDVRHGVRVSIRNEGADLEGRTGTVVHPGRESTCYAHVALDGDDHAIIVHPFSVVLI